MRTTAATRLRVGIFVLVALVIGASIAFAIGAQENVFAPKTTYHAIFDDVGGLQKGNTVRVAGVNVGSVTDVIIGESGKIEVYFRIIDDATHLIRGEAGLALAGADPEPSVAAIGSKGLLGDRIVEITVGADEYPEWDADEPIPVSVGGGIMALAERTLTEAEGTARNLRLATDPFADQEFSNDLKETARNLAKASGMIASGDGTIGRLMHDAELGRDVKGAVKELRSAGKQVAASRSGTGARAPWKSGPRYRAPPCPPLLWKPAAPRQRYPSAAGPSAGTPPARCRPSMPARGVRAGPPGRSPSPGPYREDRRP